MIIIIKKTKKTKWKAAIFYMRHDVSRFVCVFFPFKFYLLFFFSFFISYVYILREEVESFVFFFSSVSLIFLLVRLGG